MKIFFKVNFCSTVLLLVGLFSVAFASAHLDDVVEVDEAQMPFFPGGMMGGMMGGMGMDPMSMMMMGMMGGSGMMGGPGMMGPGMMGQGMPQQSQSNSEYGIDYSMI